MKKEIIYIIIIIAVIYGAIYYINRKTKYYRYFNKQLGFGTIFLDRFTNSELKTSYEYLRDYPRQGKVLTYQENPDMYLKVLAIDNKFHIFDLPLS